MMEKNYQILGLSTGTVDEFQRIFTDKFLANSGLFQYKMQRPLGITVPVYAIRTEVGTLVVTSKDKIAYAGNHKWQLIQKNDVD